MPGRRIHGWPTGVDRRGGRAMQMRDGEVAEEADWQRGGREMCSMMIEAPPGRLHTLKWPTAPNGKLLGRWTGPGQSPPRTRTRTTDEPVEPCNGEV